MSHANDVEDLLDRLTAEYTDQVDRGEIPDRRNYLDQAPPAARPGLERCLKAIDAGSARASYRPLGPGVLLGRFKILREIGRGGMALVFLAEDPDLRRVVALKVLRPGLALERAHVDRFLREGHSMARLQHPGVVQVFEVGETDGFHWIAMEYVEGPSLATVIEALLAVEDGPPRVEHLMRVTAAPQLAVCGSFEGACAMLLSPAIDGLAAAHAAGLVHRDIKPSNVLIHRDGRAVLADFGLARADDDAALSISGAPIGTPHYMAPEQADAADQSVDARTDIYGFGAMFYELLGLRRPFDGENIMQVLDAIRDSSARPLRAVEPQRSRDAEAVCAKAMEHDPARRYATADDLADDLRCLVDGSQTAARQERGGALRSFLASLGTERSRGPSEYKSLRSFLGLPLMHVVGGRPRPGRTLPWAKGWLAVGPRAAGVVAIGGISVGGIAFGGLSWGLLAFGGVALGGVSVGGTALGLRTFGGVSVGHIAVGGVAVGYGAIGGVAVGRYAAGGQRSGHFKVNPWDRRPGGDPEALKFFVGQPSPFGDLYRSILRIRDEDLPLLLDEQ